MIPPGHPSKGGAATGPVSKEAKVPSAQGHRDPSKLRDAALILPIAGILLLMPPVLSLFQTDDPDAGGPPVAIYVFSIWALLICCSFWLSRRLYRDSDDR